MGCAGGSASPEPGDPPSVSEIHPATGLARWIDRPEASQGSGGVTWRHLLERWDLIEADMQEFYGIDLDAPGLTHERSGRWLKTRILGLLQAESRLHSYIFPPEETKGGQP